MKYEDPDLKPIYILDNEYPIDRSVLLREYENHRANMTTIKQGDYGVSAEDVLGKGVIDDNVGESYTPYMINTPVVNEFTEKFIDHYKIPYNYTTVFFKIDAGGTLGWHRDLHDSSIVCNFILTESRAPVEFWNVGEFHYKSAILDVQWVHRILNDNNPRLIYRITLSGKDCTYENLMRHIKSNVHN